jgi:pyroglutamyl-peptidase
MASSSTILLTGFGPFPGVPENLSATLATRLAERAARRFPRRRVVAHTLETTWSTVPVRIGELYDRERPHVAIHFGVSERASGFVVETLATNSCRLAPDWTGALPAAPVIASEGPPSISVSLPAHDVVARLRRLGLPVALSTDAGQYLCNAALFHALEKSRLGATASCVGFIHIPTIIADAPGQASLDWDAALQGGLEIIRAALRLPAPDPRR